ncbi:hypothetical protein NPIL_396341 [Nephila pilipes]|uniref:Uncharacterized protein n=1 Tax=Nephila pilipes TaxID=299642 RepID=A0A8X6M8R2_NEPPI|nr:hypothetical protein NPIL_396341 [Nephila pilipes]
MSKTNSRNVRAREKKPMTLAENSTGGCHRFGHTIRRNLNSPDHPCTFEALPGTHNTHPVQTIGLRVREPSRITRMGPFKQRLDSYYL